MDSGQWSFSFVQFDASTHECVAVANSLARVGWQAPPPPLPPCAPLYTLHIKGSMLETGVL